MIFNTLSYFLLFLLPTSIIYRCFPLALRPWVVVAFGAAFYVFYSLHGLGGAPGAFCLGIFLWESLFSRLYRPGSWFCIVGIVQSVLFLMVFKYWNFLTGLLFFHSSNPLHWNGAFLPLGISFFTFEFIHYAVDRYRNTTPAGRFRDYFAFIFFFPTMVAGPIKRYQYFLPAVTSDPTPWPVDWQRGVTRILCGLVKKLAVADVLTALTQHLNYQDVSVARRGVLPIWVLAYGMKIYFDFSGYSDIAIGSSRLFGMRVPENFDWPYLRGNITEFWRHWHISLYGWLVDYIYIPLGGSRVARPRIYLNILLTMLISGIWHGAGLNFVAWGLWHGLLLCVHRAWRLMRDRFPHPRSAPERFAGWAITFAAVNFGWIFFATDLSTSMLLIRRLFRG